MHGGRESHPIIQGNPAEGGRQLRWGQTSTPGIELHPVPRSLLRSGSSRWGTRASTIRASENPISELTPLTPVRPGRYRPCRQTFDAATCCVSRRAWSGCKAVRASFCMISFHRKLCSGQERRDPSGFLPSHDTASTHSGAVAHRQPLTLKGAPHEPPTHYRKKHR